MPVDFIDYISALRPPPPLSKNSKASIISDFNEPDSRLESTLRVIKRWIDEIYTLIENDLTKKTFIPRSNVLEFNIKLSNLKSAFISYCQEISSFDSLDDLAESIEFSSSGEELFSKFMQHLFVYISTPIKSDRYVSRIMSEILKVHSTDFFYVKMEGHAPTHRIVDRSTGWSDRTYGYSKKG